MKKILVGTDFSAEADVALDQAMSVARHVGAGELILLFAGQIPDDHDDLPESLRVAAGRYEQIAREQLAADRKRLDDLRERFDGQGVKISTMVIDGLPADGIAEAADETGADLIVVGTHGHTGVRRLLLGSVAEKVVRESSRDVLVARGTDRGTGGYDKVLVPTDFSTTAERALLRALELVKRGGEVELLHCWSLPTSSRSWDPIARDAVAPLRDELAHHSRQETEKLAAAHARDGVTITTANVEDTPVHGVQDRLEHGGHDLVVMGSHGRRGVKRWLLGSVAEGTVRYSPCSVLVVHADDAD